MVTEEQLDEYAQLIRMRLERLADQEDRELDMRRTALLAEFTRQRKRTLRRLRADTGDLLDGRVPICPTCKQPMRINP